VPFLQGYSEGFHTWSVEEIQQFEERHPIGTKARLALALLMYTGVRRSDLIKLGRQMVRDGWLRFAETKNSRRRPKMREIPVLPELQAVIDASPKGDLTFLITKFGKPFTHGGFGNWFRHRCDEAGLKHCSAHGLRKAAATKAADNGATEWQLISIFGWESTREASRYTRRANRKRLAGEGMHLLAGRIQNREMVPLSGDMVPPPLNASDSKEKN
jgi:integrase